MTEIGTTLGGRYRLVELLGQGGMATIYRARDAQLDRDVAVKLLRPEFGQDPDFLARFRDEARAAASLNHPNIVSVFDFGEGDSGPYIVMEMVEGEDLASILREQRAAAAAPGGPRRGRGRQGAPGGAHPRASSTATSSRRTCSSAATAGSRSPTSGSRGPLTEAQLTLPGTTMGSVHYFSPEQARGEPATVASDIYALGIVLFETLTGQRPFSGDGAAAVALARLTTTPPRPSALRGGPPELDAIVTKAMSLDPAARYASAAAMASALEGYLTDAGDSAPAAVVAGAAAATVAAATARPTPVPYPPDAYAKAGPRRRGLDDAAPRRLRPVRLTATARTRRSPGRGPGSPLLGIPSSR